MNLNALPYAVRRYLRSVDKHSGEYVQLKSRIEWTELLPRQQNEGNNRGEEIGVQYERGMFALTKTYVDWIKLKPTN